MLDRDVGRSWHLWLGFLPVAWTQVDELLLDAGELVDDHPGLLLDHPLPPHPLAQSLQDVRYRLTVLLTDERHSRPRNPSQGGVMERQVGILRGGGTCQGTATLCHLPRCCIGPAQVSGRSRQGGIVREVGVGEHCG